jgi:CRP-like cAMP-binding protein
MRRIQQREVLAPEELQLLWRVESGALRIDSTELRDSSSFVHLALPGDVLGIENYAGAKDRIFVRALTPVSLVSLAYFDEGQKTQLLMDAVCKGYQRCRELVQLRTGSTDERVRRLLLMLAGSDDRGKGDAMACALPCLSNMAAIVNAAPETVCRVLANLRESKFLQDCSPQISKHKPLELRTHRLQPGMPPSTAEKSRQTVAGFPQ